MKRVFAYMRPHLLFFLIAPALKAREAVAGLLQPKIMTTTIDIGVVTGNMDVIWSNGLRMCSPSPSSASRAASARPYSRPGRRRGSSRPEASRVRQGDVAEPCRRRPLLHRVLITRITSDIVQLEHTAIMMQRIMVRAPLLAIGAVIMTLSISVELGLLLLAISGILLVVVGFIMSKAFPLFTQVQQRLDTVNSVVQENLSGMRTVKAYDRGSYEVSRFDAINDLLFRTSVRAGRTMAFSGPTVSLGMNMATLIVLWRGGQLVAGRELAIGQVVAVTQYIAQVLFSLSMLGFLLINLVRARASALRVSEVLEAQPTVVDQPDADPVLRVTRGEVEFRDVDFRYPGAAGPPTLSGISLRVPQGHTLGILGGTSSGKSTLVSPIPRLYDVTAEKCWWIDNVRRHPGELRAGVSIVLQDTVLFSGTIEDNLRWGAGPDAARRSLWLPLRWRGRPISSGLRRRAQHHHRTRGAGLSGGQRQRVSIARSLLRKAPILILDDATSALDFRTELNLRRALRRHAKGMTTIIIAQRVASVMDADEIIILKTDASPPGYPRRP